MLARGGGGNAALPGSPIAGAATMNRLTRMAAGPLGLALSTAVAWVVTGMIGCEAGGGGASLPDGGATTAPPQGASGGAGGSTGSGGVEFDAGDQDGSLDDGDTCLTEQAQAEKVPLDVFMVVDRSGSMGYCDSGNWVPTEAALIAFFNDPLSAGLSIGMNLFPSPAATGNECIPELYNPVQIPATLPLLLLPDDVGVLEATLAALHPDNCTAGTTPMYGALYGTYQFAVNYQAANPDRKAIVVLTSDGEPCCGDCSTQFGGSQYEEIPTIASIALSARGAGVLTYTIIIDILAKPALDAIALQGGTGQAYDVSSDVSLFAQALDEIRAAALSCEYPIPQTEEEFDPLKVNVVYTPGGGQPGTIPHAASAADCGSDDGWY
jgi:hypothetical protein